MCNKKDLMDIEYIITKELINDKSKDKKEVLKNIIVWDHHLLTFKQFNKLYDKINNNLIFYVKKHKLTFLYNLSMIYKDFK